MEIIKGIVVLIAITGIGSCLAYLVIVLTMTEDEIKACGVNFGRKERERDEH